MATPHSTREGRGPITFVTAPCCTRISFTCKALGLHCIMKIDKAAAHGFTVVHTFLILLLLFFFLLFYLLSYQQSCDGILCCDWSSTVQSCCKQKQTAVKEVPNPFPLLRNRMWPRKTSLGIGRKASYAGAWVTV